MNNFLKIASGWDVMPALLELHRQPHLWDEHKARLSANGPHRETHDIWIRYKDETENVVKGDYRNFGDPHDGVWYPAYYALPALRPLIFRLMAAVEGERLGGVLLYTVPPGARIYPHTDTGWHVSYYEKFNICLQSNQDAWFCYGDDPEGEHAEDAMGAVAGDVHRFRNDVPHWVVNEGEDDHIVLTVCIRTHDYASRFRGVIEVPPHVRAA